MKKIIKPIKITDVKKFYKGTQYKVSNNHTVEVVEYRNKLDVLVRFIDTGDDYTRSGRMSNIKNGSLKYPYEKIYEIGYMGEGPYGYHNFKAYTTWIDMLKRHSEKVIMKNKNNLSYRNSSICGEWLCFQNFAYWFEDYISKLNPEYYNDYQIDKDIFQWNQEFKIYSPQTCCLIPSMLNKRLIRGKSIYKQRDLPTGVYHTESGKRYRAIVDMQRRYNKDFPTLEEAVDFYRSKKEEMIRELADMYFSMGCILQDVRDQLYNIRIID